MKFVKSNQPRYFKITLELYCLRGWNSPQPTCTLSAKSWRIFFSSSLMFLGWINQRKQVVCRYKRGFSIQHLYFKTHKAQKVCWIPSYVFVSSWWRIAGSVLPSIPPAFVNPATIKNRFVQFLVYCVVKSAEPHGEIFTRLGDNWTFLK